MIFKEYFPGANTPYGFFSYYDDILKSREAKRVIVLKGGPGTGKSTFMKRIARHLYDCGYEAEMLHCSSDPDSLDGVCCRDIGFLIVDGTSPHIVDPRCPGAVDEIINLGECWNAEKIIPLKKEIIETGENISLCFLRAYRYLSAAKKLNEQIEHDTGVLVNMRGVRKELDILRENVLHTKIASCEGRERKAFLSAITHMGRVDYADTYVHNAKCVYKIVSKCSSASKYFMKKLCGMLKTSGCDVHSFYCPMSPDEKIEHIYVPVTGMLFTVENTYNKGNVSCFDYEINLDKYIDCKYVMDMTAADMEIYNMLVSRASDSLRAAKKLHDKLEEFYVPYMDFGKTESICDGVIRTLS